jgi:hypothetical protein
MRFWRKRHGKAAGLLLLMLTMIMVPVAQASGISLSVNGKDVPGSIKPVLSKGTLMVSIRQAAEAFGSQLRMPT